MQMLKITAASRFHTIHPAGRFTPIQMAEHFHKVGFEGFDFDMNEYTDVYAPEERDSIISALADKAAALGLSVDMCHLPFYGKKDIRMLDLELNHKLIKMGIEGAAKLGVRNGVIHPQPLIMPLEQFDDEDCFRKTVEYLTPLAEHAARHGVRLAIENMSNHACVNGIYRYCSMPEEVVRVADYFGAGICWDFGHANSVKLPQGDSLRYLGKRLTALHVNDNNGNKDDHLLPFWGTVDWHDAMQGLRDSGYDGCFNYECRMIKIPAELRDELGVYAVALANKLQIF